MRVSVRQARENFVRSMEQERFSRNLSMRQMAKLLDLKYSTYQKIVSGSTEAIPFRAVLHLHDISGLPMWQLCGLEMPEEFKFHYLYMSIPVEQREAVDDLLRGLIRANKGIRNEM